MTVNKLKPFQVNNLQKESIIWLNVRTDDWLPRILTATDVKTSTSQIPLMNSSLAGVMKYTRLNTPISRQLRRASIGTWQSFVIDKYYYSLFTKPRCKDLVAPPHQNTNSPKSSNSFCWRVVGELLNPWVLLSESRLTKSRISVNFTFTLLKFWWKFLLLIFIFQDCLL